MKHVLAALGALCLAACATGARPVSMDEAHSADYGTPITQADAEKQALAFMVTQRNSEGVALNCTPVVKGWMHESELSPKKNIFGYTFACFTSKRGGYRGYVLEQKVSFLFRYGMLQMAYAEPLPYNPGNTPLRIL